MINENKTREEIFAEKVLETLRSVREDVKDCIDNCDNMIETLNNYFEKSKINEEKISQDLNNK